MTSVSQRTKGRDGLQTLDLDLAPCVPAAQVAFDCVSVLLTKMRVRHFQLYCDEPLVHLCSGLCSQQTGLRPASRGSGCKILNRSLDGK